MKISSDLIKVHKSLHTWVGIVAGMLLFVGFFAGSLTMFKEPLDRWTRAGHAPVTAQWPTGLDDALVPELLRSRPDAAQELALYLQPAEHIAAPLVWSDAGGRDSALAHAHWTAGRDASGALRIAEQEATPLGELVDLLHRTGGVPGVLGDEHLGIYVMGVAAVLYFLALVSGVVVLLPTLVKDFFAVRPGRNRKRFWLDVHNVLGITSLPFHVVISLSVVVFAFHDQFYDAMAKVIYGQQPMFERTAPMPRAHELSAVMPLSAVLQRVREEAPGSRPTELLYMRLDSPRPMLRVALHHPERATRGAQHGYLLLNPYTGAVSDAHMVPGREEGWSTPVGVFFALHFGSYGGEPVRWMYFVLGLMGAGLFYTGNLLWLESRRKHQRAGAAAAQQARSVRVMAAVTVGVCLGCVLAVGAALLAGRWWMDRSGDLRVVYLWSYYAAWLAAVAWSLWRGAARAAPELLAATAAVALCIPISSVLTGAAGAWAGGASMSPLVVDGVCGASAGLLACAAWRTRQRLRLAPSDTVWSSPSSASAPLTADARS
jgi:uncharacterized iron-regulated membrane protein